MAATNILINVGAKTAGAINDLNKVNGALERQGGIAQKAGKLAKAGALAAAAGIALVVKELFDMGKEAWEDYQQAQKLQTVLENLGIPQEAIDKNAAWIASMEVATLVADKDLREAVARLAAQTGDLTVAQEQVAIATDLSVGAGISYEKALKAIQTANDGSMESIGKYVKLQDTNKDGTIDLDEAMQSLRKAYKGSARAAADNDPWKRLQVLWGNLRESLGQYMIPLLEKLGKWFSKPENQQKVQDFIDKMGKLSYEVGVMVVDALEEFWKWIKSPDGQRAMKDVKDLAVDLKDALRDLKEWFDRNGPAIARFGRLLAVPIGTIGMLIGWIRTAIGWLKDLWGWLQKATPGGILRSILGRSSLMTATPQVATFAGRTTPTTSNVINLYSSATEADARLIKRAIEGYDIAQGRYPGAPLRVAW